MAGAMADDGPGPGPGVRRVGWDLRSARAHRVGSDLGSVGAHPVRRDPGSAAHPDRRRPGSAIRLDRWGCQSTELRAPVRSEKSAMRTTAPVRSRLPATGLDRSEPWETVQPHSRSRRPAPNIAFPARDSCVRTIAPPAAVLNVALVGFRWLTAAKSAVCVRVA